MFPEGQSIRGKVSNTTCSLGNRKHLILQHCRHTLELTKQKEVAVATEKLRRERWVAEQSKKIKEITVKGLEPEIQRLIAKHKAEVQKIKVLHEVRSTLINYHKQ